MNRLLTVVSVALLGGAMIAEAQDNFPRVYQYKAALTTTVAKNAARVAYVDEEGIRAYEEDLCYRKVGKIALKGVFLYDCDCVEFDDYWQIDDWNDNLELAMMTTSEDRYQHVYTASEYFFENELMGFDYDSYLMFWTVNRINSPLSLTARVAEMVFAFDIIPTNGCTRAMSLVNAGFGKASAASRETIDSVEVASISGAVAGLISAPFCAASLNNCPRCIEDGECMEAIAFTPCVDTADIGYGNGTEVDAAYGKFSLVYSQVLSRSLYDIPKDEYQATVDMLVLLAFGPYTVAPIVD